MILILFISASPLKLCTVSENCLQVKRPTDRTNTTGRLIHNYTVTTVLKTKISNFEFWNWEQKDDIICEFAFKFHYSVFMMQDGG